MKIAFCEDNEGVQAVLHSEIAIRVETGAETCRHAVLLSLFCCGKGSISLHLTICTALTAIAIGALTK